MSLRVAHIGLGPIGAAVIKQIAARPGIETVAAIDLDPNKVGKSLDTIVPGYGALKSVVVRSDLTATLTELKPDVAVLCTSSSLPRVFPQIEEIMRAGVPIVSTTEELSFPSGPNDEFTATLDALAKECGVGVVGTGINPGFAMDALPVTLTAACERVEKIHVDRIQDASSRRLPFQQKIGAGLTLEEWQEKAASGTIRHVGLRESIAMIGAALNWEVERITDEIYPQIATEQVSSPFMTVEPGLVCGMKQDGVGYVNGEPLITLHMEAYLGAPASYEEIKIEGSPAFSMRIDGGLPGDIATAAIVVNTLPKIVAAPAGFHTMLSLPLPSFFRGSAA